MAAHQYKRSWKNLLLNKRYQLRFTLFMVGVSAVLMSGLGIWVMKEANEATTVAMIRVRGEACPKVPEVVDVPIEPAAPMTPEPAAPPGPASAAGASQAPSAASPNTDSPPEAAKAVPDAKAGDGEATGDGESPRRAVVTLDEPSMTITATLPSDFADRIVSHHICEMRQAGAISALERGRLRILWVLIGTGLLLMFGLAVYGIKMTHKVAGPLFKVTLYLAKMRDGRYDKVWNLRKGDQLVEFYEHFKHAHAGVVTMEREDIERLQATLAAAEAAGLGDNEAVAELKTLLARKEKSLE